MAASCASIGAPSAATSSVGSSCSSCSAIVPTRTTADIRAAGRARGQIQRNWNHTRRPGQARENRGPSDVGAPRALHGSRASRSDRDAAGAFGPARLPLLLGAAAPDVRRPRHVAAMRELCPRRASSARWSPSIRSTSASASNVSWCSSRSSWRPRRSSPSTPTSLPTRTPGSLTRAPTSSRWSSASGWGPQPGRRAGKQRRLPAPACRRTGHTRAGGRARGNVAEAARERGIETVVEFFGRELASRLVAERAPGRPAGREQRVRPCPGPQRLRRRHAAGAGSGGRGDDRVPPPRTADGGEPVRHDLPRALLLLLVPHRPERASQLTASRCSTSRSCPPTAAR